MFTFFSRFFVVAAAAILMALISSCETRPSAAKSRLGLEALTHAYNFATAIHEDPDDKARSQAMVVVDMAELGWCDEALARVGRINGWHQGTALADVAYHLARTGRSDEARPLLTKAVAVAKLAKDWYEPRIYAHVAQARAALGEVDQAEALSKGMDRDEFFKVTTAAAAGFAQAGKFEEAMARLHALDDSKHFEATWPRTMGYLHIAQQPELRNDQRDQALLAARRSANTTIGPRRTDALIAVADAYRKSGNGKTAQDVLELVSVGLKPEELDAQRRHFSIAGLAGAWGRLGQRQRAVSLLQGSLSCLDRMQDIDRPIACALVAGAYADAGEHERAWAVYQQAVTLAGTLKNARPRALALVEICRSVGRHQLEFLPEIRQQLDQLLKGLAPKS
jgi:tetratricopeptide (TPR) repeat protein